MSGKSRAKGAARIVQRASTMGYIQGEVDKLGVRDIDPLSKEIMKSLQDVVDMGCPIPPSWLLRYALRGIGWNPNLNSETASTPERFLRYLGEFLRPFDPAECLGTGFTAPRDNGIHSLVVQSNIPFRMICEHHLLPAFGLAHVGYIPRERVVGLSKLARLVEGLSTTRPTMQELLSEQIADALVQHLKPAGAMVLIEAEHTCMACRGVKTPGVVTSTQTIRGVFRDVPAAREEFMQLVSQAANKGSNR